MKKRLKEMEEEVAALHEMQAKVESHLDSAQGFFFGGGLISQCQRL